MKRKTFADVYVGIVRGLLAVEVLSAAFQSGVVYPIARSSDAIRFGAFLLFSLFFSIYLHPLSPKDTSTALSAAPQRRGFGH